MSHYDSLLEFCSRHTHIYCYGAGNMGRKAVTFLQKYGINIVGYIVSNKEEENVLGIKVWQLDEISVDLSDQMGIILSLNEIYHKEVMDKFHQLGYIDDARFFHITYRDCVEKILPDLAESKSYFNKIENNAVMYMFLEHISSIENSKITRFEADYEVMCHKYKQIIFAQYDMRTIGIMGLTYFLWNIEKKDDVLYVMTPIFFEHDRTNLPNTYFYEKIREKIEIITEGNYEFWRWVLQYHREGIVFSDDYSWSEIKKRDTDYKDIPYSLPFEVELDVKEWEIVDKMQLHKEFVCIFNRDNEYYKYRGLESDTDKYRYRTSVRNMPVVDYKLLSDVYFKKKIPLVRMGYQVADSIEMEGIIDYANKFRTEKLDFYLISKSKFFMESNSGIMFIALLFNIPVVMVNSCVISFGGDTVAPTTSKRDLIITKKLWYQKQNRYLSLDEMLFMEGKFKSYELFDAYRDIGVEFHCNSPKELLDIAEEMRGRLDGDYAYTEWDETLQKCYRNILERNIHISNNHYYDARFGASFLRENKWFLDDIPDDVSIKNIF